MTRKEAIKIINCYDIGFYDLSGEKIPADKLADAFDMAIEALQADVVPKHDVEIIIDEITKRTSPTDAVSEDTQTETRLAHIEARLENVEKKLQGYALYGFGR